MLYIYIYIYITFSSVDGYFISQLLWKTLQSIWECRYLFQVTTSFPLDTPRSEMLHHMVDLFLVFWGTCILFFPQWLCQFIFSPTVHKISLFSTSSPTFLFNSLIIGILTVVSLISLWLWFLRWWVMLSTFSCTSDFTDSTSLPAVCAILFRESTFGAWYDSEY